MVQPLTLKDAERMARDFGGNPDDDSLRRMLEHLTGTGKKAELIAVEFKSGFDDSQRAWLQLLAESVALSNSGGGVIIYGVGDDGERLGTDASVITNLDAAKINDQLRRYSPDSTLLCVAKRIDYEESIYVAVGVGPGTGIIVFDKDGNTGSPGKTKAVFRSGYVYVRRPGQKTPATQAEITELVRRLAETQANAFLARVEKAVRLPAGEELVAVPASSLSEGRILTGTREGATVRVEVVPEGEGVPVAELTDPGVPYRTLKDEVAQQVRAWRQGNRPHSVSLETLADWYKRRDDIPVWSNDELEFGLRSALQVRGFPNWWATQMTPEALNRVIRNLIDDNKYPDREYIPYLIASQFWNQRGELWDVLLESSGSFLNVKRTITRLEKMEYEDFLERAKKPAMRFEWQGQRMVLAEVIADVDLARTIFAEMLAADASAALPANQRPVAQQLDITLHARGL